jgi:hypothetical protein
MIHPDIRLDWRSDHIGYGLFATAHIPAGTMVYVQDDLDIMIPQDSPLLQDPRYHDHIDKYCVIDANGNHIVGWDISKYANHCCHYNSLATAYGFEIAIRDILPGEEVTDDYVAFNLETDMPLTCHYEDCRRVLHPEDFEGLTPVWDVQVRQALQFFLKVPQPLLAYLPASHHRSLLGYLETGAGYRSVEMLRYRP